MKPWTPAFAPIVVLLAATPVLAQDLHIHLPTSTIERYLEREPFEITEVRGSRGDGDRTQRVLLEFRDELMTVKWAVAPQNGETYNNVPRYEVAAYELQKLFLDEPHYVVPPTVLRAFPLAWYRNEYQPGARSTFSGSESVFVTLQFWLWPPVTPHNQLDAERFRKDEAYAAHFANLNVLTYLIRHRDANVGNVLISESPDPRLFSVDNGVAFSSIESDRGQYWSELRVGRIPAATAARLKAITAEDLERHLGVLAQFESTDGQYERVERGANLRPGSGIRRVGNLVQLGLTAGEIRGVHDRLVRLVRQIDAGRIETF